MSMELWLGKTEKPIRILTGQIIRNEGPGRLQPHMCTRSTSANGREISEVTSDFYKLIFAITYGMVLRAVCNGKLRIILAEWYS